VRLHTGTIPNKAFDLWPYWSRVAKHDHSDIEYAETLGLRDVVHPIAYLADSRVQIKAGSKDNSAADYLNLQLFLHYLALCGLLYV
jgi:hypothetical protein